MGKVITALFYEVFLCLKIIPVLSLRDSAVEVLKELKNLLTKLNFPGSTLDFEAQRFGPGMYLRRRINVLEFKC